ncbi:MAG: hypothetical protein NT001_04900 [Candidatus Woesearchaeota archaeon]|nr:hypothetical protein [Candidatus Woesearchaeota archaeon]
MIKKDKKTEENKKDILILFDVGGVLLKLDYNRFYEAAARLSGTMNAGEFKNRFVESGIEFMAIKGEIKAADYLQRLREMISPQEDATDDELKRIRGYCWKERVDEAVSLKRRLHENKYSVGILSNISDFALETISSRYPEMLETYDRSSPRIYSFQIGSMKPELLMYQAIKGYNKVILIDDKESYLRTGIEEFGWNGILFTPFIDEAEAIRSIHNNKEIPRDNFSVAGSMKELESSLNKLGIKTE